MAVIGSEPQIYFYAHRLSATGFIYTYDLVGTGSNARQLQMDMIQEIESTKPKILVLVLIPMSWQARDGADSLILDWAIRYSQRGYEQLGLVDFTKPPPRPLQTGSNAANFPPQKVPCILVYRRKAGASGQGSPPTP